MERGYQYNYSTIENEMYDVSTRERKANTMLVVLEEHIDTPLNQLSVLNVGGSTGIIDNYLSDHFKSVTGVDIDEKAIEHASQNFVKDNLKFEVGDAMNLPYENDSFDIVISSHIYEHVPDASRMMAEIHRVLKNNGTCYFAGCNRIMWNEPHYNLPLLSVIPRVLAHFYVKIFRDSDHYYEIHYSYWGLKKLVKDFVVTDYTEKTVVDPVKYKTDYMVVPGSIKARLAAMITKYALWLCPGYIWLLQKSSN